MAETRRSLAFAWRLAALALIVAWNASAQGWERGELYAPAGQDTDTIAPPVPREFRAVWIATVANIDWPSSPGLGTEEQKRELREQFDLARRLRLNAVVFQVRPAGDALYRSSIEPWSYFLTRAMGRAPDPAWDPLSFAVEEAHARGLELHAWFNPYRARHPGDSSRRAAASHVSRRAPALVKRYGPYQWMDPGEPAVRRLTQRVILDVVRRYDVDGVHIDDYFYPYPERNRRGREIPFPDERSWRAYRRSGGSLSRDDWRRHNVDTLVHALYSAIKGVKPWVKFGVSPFGIWRPGYPDGVQGFDAYDRLYADSRKWLNEGWVDYFTPQLYWPLAAPHQPYSGLLAWWVAENRASRHIWPGNFTSRASSARPVWGAREVLDQIDATRAQLGPLSGNVHFSMAAFTHNRDSLVERLTSGAYAFPALVPASPWLASGAPRVPSFVRRVDARGVELRVTPAEGPSGSASPRWWVIRALYPDGWRVRVVSAGARLVQLASAANGTTPRHLIVTGVDRVGVETAPAVEQPFRPGA